MNGIRIVFIFALLCMFTATTTLCAGTSKKEKKLQRRKNQKEALANASGQEESPNGQVVNGVQLPLLPPILDETQMKVIQKLPDFSPFVDAIKDLRKINKSIRKKSGPSKVLKEQRKKAIIRVFQVGKRLRENYDSQLRNLEKREKDCQNKINQESNDHMIEKLQTEMERILATKERPQLIIDIINSFLFEALEEPLSEDDSESNPNL